MDNLTTSTHQPKRSTLLPWAGEQIVKRIPPMPIYAFIRDENLKGRFENIFDPMPGKFDLVSSLEDLEVAGWVTVGDLNNPPELKQALICAPDPRQFAKVAKFGLENLFEYIAIFSHCMQLGGLRRFKNLYSINPPNRIYLISEAWSVTRKNRGGSDGAWQPAIWAVWDGGGGPAIHNPPKHPTLHWIGDSSSKG